MNSSLKALVDVESSRPDCGKSFARLSTVLAKRVIVGIVGIKCPNLSKRNP